MPTRDRRNVHLYLRLADDSAWNTPLFVSVEELHTHSRHPIRWLMFMARCMTSTPGILSLSSSPPLAACKEDEPVTAGTAYYYHQGQFDLMEPHAESTFLGEATAQSNGHTASNMEDDEQSAGSEE